MRHVHENRCEAVSLQEVLEYSLLQVRAASVRVALLSKLTYTQLGCPACQRGALYKEAVKLVHF
jgi:hypothetical protein